MKTLLTGAGYVLVDHTNSPGLTAKDVAGIPGGVAMPEGTRYERDMKTCAHCQNTVILNPGRVRDRAVCQKCHAYLCDTCGAAQGAGAACLPFEVILDRVQALQAKHAGQRDHPELLSVTSVADLSYTSAPRIVVPSSVD